MDVFDQLRGFLDAAEKQAADYINKGADFLEGMSAYLRKLAAGVKFAAGPDDASLDEMEARALELKAVGADPTDPKKIDPATIALIVTAVVEFIKFLRERRKPT